MESQLQSLVSRLEQVANRLESQGGVQQPQQQQQQQQVSNKDLKPFPSMEDVWGDSYTTFKTEALKQHKKLQQAVGHVCEAVDFMIKVFQDSYNHKKPSKEMKEKLVNHFKELTKPLSGKVFRSRKFKQDKELRALEEGLKCVYWVLYDCPKQNIIEGNSQSCEFRGNKTIRDLEKADRMFMLSYIKMWKSLYTYVDKHLKMGLLWEFDGEVYNPFEEKTQGGQGPPPPGPPPPPPPGPPPTIDVSDAPQKNVPDFLAEIDKLGYDGLKKGLRHVTKRKKGTVDNRPKTKPRARKEKVVKKVQKKAKKPARIWLNNKDWIIENFEGKKDIEIKAEDISLDQKIRVMRCHNCYIRIPGKVNTVQLFGCNKTMISVTQTIGDITAASCNSLKLEVTKESPSVVLDGCQSVVLYLPRPDRCEIVTSMTSELNICYKSEDGSYSDQSPVPFQMITKWNSDTKSFETLAYTDFM